MKVERVHGYCFHRIDAAVKLSLACFSQSTEPSDDDIRYLVIGRGTQVSAGASRSDGLTATQLWSEPRAHTDDEFRSTL